MLNSKFQSYCKIAMLYHEKVKLDLSIAGHKSILHTLFFYNQLHFASRAKSCLIIATIFTLVSQQLLRKFSMNIRQQPLYEARNLTKCFLHKHIDSLYCVLGVNHVLLLINFYFSLNLDFCKVSKTFHTFEKVLESIKISLNVA